MLNLTPTLMLTLTLIFTLPWTKNQMITLALTLSITLHHGRYHRTSNCRQSKCRITINTSPLWSNKYSPTVVLDISTHFNQIENDTNVCMLTARQKQIIYMYIDYNLNIHSWMPNWGPNNWILSWVYRLAETSKFFSF